jgi:gentisate 1,2-dioxygenase
MPTIRAEFHRLRSGIGTRTCTEVGSSVWQVFEGEGAMVVGGRRWHLGTGDLVVVPSWVSWSIEAETDFDLFRFSDGPIIERLGFARSLVTDGHTSLSGQAASTA